MNKLNLLLLISMVVIAGGCRKVELPDPKEEEPVFGFWSGNIGETPMVINNDSMFMTTKIIKDPVFNINTFETTFKTIGTEEPRWILRYRDSKSMRTAADTSDLFYISESRYLKNNLIDDSGGVVTHSLMDASLGNEVVWNYSDISFKSGRHFSAEKIYLSGLMKVQAKITSNGKENSIEKRYNLPRKNMDLADIIITGDSIAFILDSVSGSSPSVRYKVKGSSTTQMSNKFKIPASGNYEFEISDAPFERHLLVNLYLELANGIIKQPKVPFFSSGEPVHYPKLPNFSMMEVVYFDEDGTEYSTRYADQPKPFSIFEIETFHKANQQGQKVKKLNVEFSVVLKTANGIKSISMDAVKGDIGFAYE